MSVSENPDVCEYINCGTYWADEWRNSSDMTVDVRCRDYTRFMIDKDFEGGKVEFDPLHGELEYDGRKQGSMIMFPSFLKHRVNFITSGIRYAVNGWSYGPSWR